MSQEIQLLLNQLPEGYQLTAIERQELGKLAIWAGQQPILLELIGKTLRQQMLLNGKSLSQALEWWNHYLRREKSTQNILREVETFSKILSKVISISLKLYSSYEQQLLYKLSIFPGDVDIPESVVVRLWSQTPSTNNLNFGSILDRFADHFFQIQSRNTSLHRFIRFQPLFQSCFSEMVGSDTWRKTHQFLLTTYNPHRDPWFHIPDDGYLYQYLVYHLCNAELFEELNSLLIRTPDWMEAKIIATGGISSYIADLELALKNFADPVDAKQLCTLVSLHAARYAAQGRYPIFQSTMSQSLPKSEVSNHNLQFLHPTARFTETRIDYEIEQNEVNQGTPLRYQLPRESNTLSDRSVQPEIQRHLTASLAQAGYFQEAERIARNIHDEWSQAGALRDLVEVLIQTTRFKDAEHVAVNIQNEGGRMDILRVLVAELAQSGFYVEAERIARNIHDEWSQAGAFRHLAIALANTEHSRVDNAINDAYESARKIRNERRQATSLGVLSKELAQAHNFEKAEQVARSIQVDRTRAEALCNLAANLAQSDNDQAEAIFTETHELICNIPEYWQQIDILYSLLTNLVQANFVEKAKQIAYTIQNKETQVELQRNLVLALAQTGHFEEAKQLALDISDEKRQVLALHDLVRLLVQAERLKDAEQIIHCIADISIRAVAMCDLITALVKMGQIEEANRLTYNIEDSTYQSEALRCFALALAQIGHFEEAEHLIYGFEDSTIQVNALAGLVSNLIQAGDLKKAESVIRSIQNENVRKSVSNRLAEAQAKSGLYCQAFSSLAISQTGDFIQVLADWSKYFETRLSKSALEILERAILIASWTDPDWTSIYELLSKQSIE